MKHAHTFTEDNSLPVLRDRLKAAISIANCPFAKRAASDKLRKVEWVLGQPPLAQVGLTGTMFGPNGYLPGIKAVIRECEHSATWADVIEPGLVSPMLPVAMTGVGL